MKKVQAATKNNQKFRRDIKDKDRAAHKMRKEIIDLKHMNQNLTDMVKEYKSNEKSLRAQPPRMYSSNIVNSNTT